jgi:flagellar motor switch protein FliM
MTLGDVRALKPGQTIRLGRRPDEPLEVHVGGVPLARATIGQRRSNIAVRLATDVARGPLT